MKTENKVLMQQARQSLEGKWGLAIGTCLVSMLIGMAPQLIFKLGLLVLLFEGPLSLGLAIFSLKLSRNQHPHLENIFDGFRKFSKALGAFFLILLFTILWMLLLVIPGIIAVISYSQTYYILADDDTIEAHAAIDKSKKMMDGYKWKYFCLQCRFIGWALLCVLTLGLGFLLLIPYMQITMAKFYDDIKEPNQAGIPSQEL